MGFSLWLLQMNAIEPVCKEHFFQIMSHLNICISLMHWHGNCVFFFKFYNIRNLVWDFSTYENLEPMLVTYEINSFIWNSINILDYWILFYQIWSQILTQYNIQFNELKGWLNLLNSAWLNHMPDTIHFYYVFFQVIHILNERTFVC